MRRDKIQIEELAVDATIGVPDEERATPQRLLFSITLVPRTDFADLRDDLERTVDYAAVADEVRTFVSRRAVKLIETLADELAANLLERFTLREVEVEVRKFILPQTKYVSVRVIRSAS